MRKDELKSVLERMGETWKGMSAKGKLAAAGTVALVALSVFLATGNVVERIFEQGSTPSRPAALSASEEAGLIPEDAEPIPFASEETQLVTSLMAILGNEECAWIAMDDPICAIGFTPEGFDEYTGDIKASHTLEFYSIEVTENGRSGIWRITYADGTIHDARFTFIQDTERGVLVLSSSALPHGIYESSMFTSGSLSAW